MRHPGFLYINNIQRMTRPVLSPMYSLGSGSRSAAAILLGGPHAKISSQSRAYAAEKRAGRGAEYYSLLTSLYPAALKPRFVHI